MSVHSEFGDAIVKKCIELYSPRNLNKVEVLSWDSPNRDNSPITRHVIYRRMTTWRMILLGMRILKDTVATADIEIHHGTGLLKFRGSFQESWFHRNVLSFKSTTNTCERLADPYSMERIGQNIAVSVLGKYRVWNRPTLQT